MATALQLVYIAGYGRSGSTLLDLLLGNHPRIFGAGELNRLFSSLIADEACACGALVRECPFWCSVLKDVFQELPDVDVERAARITKNAESITRLSRDVGAYVTLWQTTMQAIANASNCGLVVDSSKSSRLAHHRLALMHSRMGLPTKVIHLVRDPRAVIWSRIRGNDQRLEKGDATPKPGGAVRTLASWAYANVAAESNRQSEFKRLRYEDLMQTPLAALNGLSDFLGIDTLELSQMMDPGASLSPGHGIGGNRMRRSGPVVVRFDDQWRDRLPRRSRAMAMLVHPLLVRYGYG